MRRFLPVLTAEVNEKGVLDIDTVKGCRCGVARHTGGCYGLCYAYRLATARGFDFSVSVSREPITQDEGTVERTCSGHSAKWFRVGVMGDPSHDWPLTLYVCEWLSRFRIPVIVTKHWAEIPSRMLARFAGLGAVFNTSCSALDTDAEIDHRISQHYRMLKAGIKSLLRVVTVACGDTTEGRTLASRQQWLMMHGKIIDTPLRVPKAHPLVTRGTIRVTDSTGGTAVSRWDQNVYIGHCDQCPDQCGAA